MKKFTLIYVFFMLVTTAFSQENCGNGIDDDGDGFIDCFDTDCINTPVPSGLFFNTASNGSGGTLPGGATDLNWQISGGSIAGPYVPATVMSVIPPVFYTSPWPDCNWISHGIDGMHVTDSNFFYKIEFMLPCFTPCGSIAPTSSAFCLNLDFYADNSVDAIYVNGVSQTVAGVPVATPFYNPGYSTAPISTSLCNNWKPGLNVLIIKVASGVPIEGLLVQASTSLPPFVVPNPTITPPTSTTLCDQSPPITLTAASAGGTWSASCGACINATSGVFNPTTAGAGTYTVIYTITTPCPAADTITITVIPAANMAISQEPPRCETDAAFNLTVPVTGGTWSGTGITNAANGTFDPATAGVGSHVITYTITTPCPATDTVTIVVNPVATANAGPVQTICEGSSVTLAGSVGGSATSGTWGGGNGTYNPNNNTLNAVYTPSAAEVTAGSVTLTLISNDPPGPCPVATSTVVITINPAATINAGPDQTICVGGSATLAGVLGGASATGAWSGGAGTYNPNNTIATATYTPTAAEEAAGTITLTYTSDDPSGPCPAVSDQIVITIGQTPTANAGIAQSVCSGATFTLNGSIGGAATSGTWSGGTGTFSPNNTSLTASYTPSTADITAGTITLTLTTDDPLGPCLPASSTVVLTFYPNPVVNFSVDVPKGCPIHCVNFTDLTTVTAPSTISTWNWNFGDSQTATSQNPNHCYNTTGFYDVTLAVTTSNGCADTLTIPQMIQVYAIPTAAFDPTPNPISSLTPTATMIDQSSSDVVYWNWDFGDGNTHPDNITANPSHTYPNAIDESYMVTLIVQNADGCWDTVAHPVIVGPEFSFFIPNAFTPNEDGINEDFNGTGVGIVEYDIWIFDRWGNMIFHTNKYKPFDAWDGRANDGKEIAQQDVYVWKVKLVDVFKKQHKYIGTVTLVK